jgi:hypothetical protein
MANIGREAPGYELISVEFAADDVERVGCGGRCACRSRQPTSAIFWTGDRLTHGGADLRSRTGRLDRVIERPFWREDPNSGALADFNRAWLVEHYETRPWQRSTQTVLRRNSTYA